MTPDNNSTEGNQTGKETAGRNSSEDRDTVIEIEVEHGTDGDSRQLMTRSGTQFIATGLSTFLSRHISHSRAVCKSKEK